jgi:hypothetical protein
MSWHTVTDAARIRGCTPRQIYRLIDRGKLQTQPTADGTQVWIESDERGALNQGTHITHRTSHTVALSIPTLPPSKITPHVQEKVDAMLSIIDGMKSPLTIDGRPLIPPGTVRVYKNELRKLFALLPRTPLWSLSSHPQIRQALEYVVCRQERSDKNRLRSAQDLIVVKESGEAVSVEGYLLALYAWENHNAVSTYRSLKERAEAGAVLWEKSQAKATLEDLPAETTILRWLRTQRRNSPALRRARMTKSKWEAEEMVYIARNPEEYRPGGYLYGDHTELDNLVYRLDGPIGTITTGHLWVTMFIDYRTSLPKGWVLSRQPNSLTIAQAFRNAVLGTQLRVATKDGWMPIGVCDAPEDVGVDRGKDYKSKYTQQVVAQEILFEPEAETAVRRVTKLHYVTKHHPLSKAQQERFFRTVQEITRYLPGYKGATYQDKPDELKNQLARFELLTEDEFSKAFDEAVWAYSNRPRRDLGGMSPMEFYLQHQQYVRRIDERVLDLLMMKPAVVSGKRTRKVERGYVTVDGTQYFSLDLEGHTGRDAMIYRDPQDLGRAAIYIDGEFITVAINKQLMGVTEADRLKWVKAREKRDKVMMEQIRQLRQGMSSKEIKQLLWAGETKNVKKLELDLIRKQIDQRIIVTGLEGTAEQVADEMAAVKQQQKDAKRAKKDVDQVPVFTPESVKNI